MWITRFTQTAAIVGGLISLGIVIRDWDYADLVQIHDAFGPDIVDRFAGMILTTILIPMTLLIHVWIILPFALAFRHAPKLSSSKVASLLLLLTVVILAVWGNYHYWDVFIIGSNPDPQSGLIALFVPLYQLVAFFILRECCDFIAQRFSGKSSSRR